MVISRLSTHFESKPLVRTLQISIEPKEMSGLFNIDDANQWKYWVVMLKDIHEVLETMQIEEEEEEEEPIDVEVQLIETFVEFESATNFKGFKALHNIVLDIDDPLLCSDVQTEARHMYGELRRSFETFSLEC